MEKDQLIRDAQLFSNEAKQLSTVWHRCKDRPTVQGVALRWDLDHRKPFTAFEAYNSQAHREFINAESDDKLIDFVQKWGPPWRGDMTLSLLRKRRDELAAWARILGSAGSTAAAQAVCFLLHSEGDIPILAASLRAFLGGHEFWYESDLRPFDHDLECRILRASHQEGARICGSILQFFDPSMNPLGIVMDRNRPRAIYRFLELSDAFKWMLWQDLFKERPFRICARKECGHIVIQKTARFQKFCCEECERRPRDKKYAKLKREALRKQGLTSRGTEPKRSSALKPKRAGQSKPRLAQT